MKPVAKMSQAEIAAFVQTRLAEKGIRLALSGGAVVAVYSTGKYVSKDIDLVNMFFAPRTHIKIEMQNIGFVETGRHFKHPDSQHVIEFPPGPLSLGMEPVEKLDQIQLPTGVLWLLSPTDCVKDRLAAYYHWNDKQCLEQAILVSLGQKIDLSEIKRWSEHEGKSDQFKLFKKRYDLDKNKP